MGNATTLRVAQLSDTHFLAAGDPAEGGFAYDTDESFAAVLAHMAGSDFDLVAVTGDVTDHGRADQYRVAAAALERLDAPVNVCPGNHDQDLAFSVGMSRPSIATSRVVELGEWCFLFVDSNAGVMSADASGRAIDPPDYHHRLENSGALGPAEAAWIQAMHNATLCPHVFIWLHHPPSSPMGLVQDHAYSAEWDQLLPTLPKLRGLGAGHTHVPDRYDLDGRPVFVAPSLKNNFDMAAETLLPPGYRTYEFAPDGTVTSDVQLVEDPRWPRHAVGRAVMALLNGELSWQEFDAIVERKSAG